jgi:tripartite-type tricarboxylate transporter receptor subunit TctC
MQDESREGSSHMRAWSRRDVLAAGAALPFALATPAGAQAYPSRPIRIIIPYTAGGVAETIVRLLAVSMEKRLGQRFVVEAKPGGAGNVGTFEVANAQPDGHTLLVAATNNFVINQYMMKMAFDPLATLAPIAKLAEVPLVMFTNTLVPFRTFPDLIAYGRARPGQLGYGIPSLGTVNHLLIERLKQETGIDMAAIPYRGSPQATLALLANEIQLFPIGLAAGAGALAEGKLVALAVATPERLPMLPQVPTIAESGFPGFVASNWWGMAAPKGTPEPILGLLHEAVAEALQSESVGERFRTLGFVPDHRTRDEFSATMVAEAQLWRGVVERGRLSIPG